MASETRLNQIVKGAPSTDIRPSPPPLQSLGKASEAEKHALDPHLSSLPSSPPQIYLNLLILESSLRAQYLHLVARRRLNTFFLLLLGLWNGVFFYALFLRPREDGVGLGGSVYWVVETSEKLALMGGLITVLLVWGTGQWERGIRWPRKWLGTTNRGLRGFNLRVVVIRGEMWREMLGHLSFLLPFGLWREAGGSDWHFVEHETGTVVEEDLAKGGAGVMLLLLPKSFSPEFRENWEEYRTEYWEKENERRAGLRRKLHTQRRGRAKEAGGWKWWTGAWRLASARHHHNRHHDLEKHPHHANRMSVSEKDPLAHRRGLSSTGRRRTNLETDSTHSRSRQSSRSSTPQLDHEALGGGGGVGQERPLHERVRRGSSVSSTASVRRNAAGGRMRERDREGGTPIGTPLLSPLTSASGEDDAAREERRRRRRERDAEKREREKTQAEEGPRVKKEKARDVKIKKEMQEARPGAGLGIGVPAAVAAAAAVAGDDSLPPTPQTEDFSLETVPSGVKVKVES